MKNNKKYININHSEFDSHTIAIYMIYVYMNKCVFYIIWYQESDAH
jgi:hypothetical protein